MQVGELSVVPAPLELLVVGGKPDFKQVITKFNYSS